MMSEAWGINGKKDFTAMAGRHSVVYHQLAEGKDVKDLEEEKNLKKAKKIFKKGALLTKKYYTSWKDLSVGYQFGRAVWGGLEEYDELKEGMGQLLTEKDSPRVTMAFNMKLNFEESTTSP
jgi:hypothetical protein